MYLSDGVEHCSMELSSTKMACTRIITIVGTCLWDGLFFHGANLNKNGIYQNYNKSMYLSNGVEHCSMELSSTKVVSTKVIMYNDICIPVSSGRVLFHVAKLNKSGKN